MDQQVFGIIGGAGMLGAAILRAVLRAGEIPEQRLWVSSRSGRLAGFEAHADITTTSDNAALVAACDVVLLCVPPAAFGSLNVSLADKLVLSVMAGITMDQITAQSGATRVIRAMSSPAAEQGLAYSPWVATDAVGAEDRAFANRVFAACGETDQITEEAHLDVFTAMTGPVPGFVAFFAETMVQYATDKGLAPAVADRAVRQLFLGAGQMMAEGPARPSDHVQEMIDYAGTTAAGLQVLRQSQVAELIGEGLDASVAKCCSMG
ncbi:pyrroline-5-carboxylate reductase [Phaeobacter sp. HF9A]|uniref:pyrroline-5-carboxylate reductase family protein n=1 Tax=Phaeobacter sp. HF9A TaxID=2721561 RepID=UPI00142F5760|nr:pyrroline-5-carboxylate reductase dimerization domain-containing protein [Phaeobacter sp. HF9A]NIZ13524.1 NAD(P)-binding domain-containing protein [Phaeobacter sp. HF9A]